MAQTVAIHKCNHLFQKHTLLVDLHADRVLSFNRYDTGDVPVNSNVFHLKI